MGSIWLLRDVIFNMQVWEPQTYKLAQAEGMTTAASYWECYPQRGDMSMQVTQNGQDSRHL